VAGNEPKVGGWLPRLLGRKHAPGSMLLLILRGFFGAVIIGIATAALFYFDSIQKFQTGLALFAGILFLGFSVVALDILIKGKQVTTISAVYFGLLMGFLLSSLFWSALETLVQ